MQVPDWDYLAFIVSKSECESGYLQTLTLIYKDGKYKARTRLRLPLGGGLVGELEDSSKTKLLKRLEDMISRNAGHLRSHYSGDLEQGRLKERQQPFRVPIEYPAPTSKANRLTKGIPMTDKQKVEFAVVDMLDTAFAGVKEAIEAGTCSSYEYALYVAVIKESLDYFSSKAGCL